MLQGEFKAWHRTECARRMGTWKTVDQVVDEAMAPQNLKVEYF